jgi:hypothetical protein
MSSIVAVTGIAGHAFGSWRGRGNLRRMWLQDFLQKDLPNCRTMIFGYNSKLDSPGIHQIEDYRDNLLTELKKARVSGEVSIKASHWLGRTEKKKGHVYIYSMSVQKGIRVSGQANFAILSL